MYRSRRFLYLVGVLALSAVLAGCSGSSGPAPEQTTVQQISGTQLQALMDGDATVVVLDVRSAAEFEAGYIPGSINIPLDQLSSRVNELDPNVPVVCVCASGYRSIQAAEMLVAEGFSSVMNLQGGVREWNGAWEPECPVC